MSYLSYSSLSIIHHSSSILFILRMFKSLYLNPKSMVELHNRGHFITRYLKERLHQFLLKEEVPSPYVVFAVFLYLHLQLEILPPQFNLIFFAAALVIIALTNFNFLFLIAPFIGQNLMAGLIMFGICLLGCNEKWKFYLFILTIGDNLFESNSRELFLCIFSLFLCIESYRIMVFKTIQENIQYFSGFSGIFACYLLRIVFASLNLENHFILQVCFTLIAISTAYRLINQRVQEIKDLNPNRIKNERVMARYLQILEQELDDKLLAYVLIKMHILSCEEMICFCSDKKLRQKPVVLIRQMYLYAIKKFVIKKDPLLFQNYVSFLIKKQQSILALIYLSEWKPQNYFEWIAQRRSVARIQEFIDNENTINRYGQQYEYALAYDYYCKRVRVEINSILAQKIKFWSQLARQKSSVLRIQTLGYSIIDKMNNLNEFYNKLIKIYEEKLYNFDSTVIYAMYLLSTTNFKDYAELIIKKTAKLLEEAQISENDASETFAIRTIVLDRQKYHRQNGQEPFTKMNSSFQQLLNKDMKQPVQNRYKLVIDSVSNGFCKLMSIQKSDLLGEQLTQIIPDGYKEVHNIRLEYLLDFDNQSNISDIVPSNIMHKELKLPIKGVDQELLLGFVCIKFQVDIHQGLTFISVIKKTQDKSMNILMNFKGEVTEAQKDFPLELLEHSELQKYLEELKVVWQKDKFIKEQNFDLMANRNSYRVTISSPLLGLFLQKENLVYKTPPIHIQITNEETKNGNMVAGKYNKTGVKIRQMEKQIVNLDHESSTSSKKSGSLAINTIFIFSEEKYVPVYRLLQIGFVLVMLVGTLSNLGGFYSSALPWDPSSIQYNPINDTLFLDYMELSNIKILLLLKDQMTFMQNQDELNTTRISNYVGYNYESYTQNNELLFEKQLRGYIFNSLKFKTPFLKDSIKENSFYSKNHNVDSTYAGLEGQNISYLQLKFLFLSDVNLLINGKLSSTIIQTIKNPFLDAEKDQTLIMPGILQSFKDTTTNNIAISVSLMVLIFILLIPLFVLFRKRLAQHEKLFDLFTSIETDQIQSQIQSIEYVINIIRNHKESGQKLKGNVRAYQENTINPKSTNKRKRSIDNEIVLGLERYDKEDQLSKQLRIKDSIRGQASIENNKSRFFDDKVSNQNFISAIKTQFSENGRQKIVTRKKRAGELNLENSFLDPNKRIILQHFIIYLLCLSFIFIIGLNIYKNSTFVQYYKQNILELQDTIDMQKELQLAFLQIKDYLLTPVEEVQSDEIQQAFQLMNEFYDDKNRLQDKLTNLNQIIAKCEKRIKTLCQESSSYILMKNQFINIIKKLIETKHSLAGQDQHQIEQVQINIKQKIFFLQSLNNRMESIVMNKMNEDYIQTIRQGASYYMFRLVLLLIALGWGLLCMIVGIIIIKKMKQKYMKEVYMITFLNGDMIQKNKRIESFIESISKNNNT